MTTINKILILLLSFTCQFLWAEAQNTVNSTTDININDHSSYGDAILKAIDISYDYTIATIEYVSSTHTTGCWISISSSMCIKSSKLKQPLKIIAWGTNEGVLELDQQYSVTADRKYTLYLVFPRIPKGITTIEIDECVGANSFRWKNVHINNTKEVYPEEETSTAQQTVTREDDFQPEVSGTGFALTSNGLIATCSHVVESARKIRIRGINGDFNRSYRANVELIDTKNDLAILKITEASFSSLGNIPYTISNKISDVGEDAFILGYPLRALMGDEIKLTNGIVSSQTGFQGDATSYQLSVPVQAGNSGGPAFNQDGEIIGVATSRLYVENASYAVKSLYLRNLFEMIGTSDKLNTNNSLKSESLSNKVKKIKKFIYIIEVEQ